MKVIFTLGCLLSVVWSRATVKLDAPPGSTVTQRNEQSRPEHQSEQVSLITLGLPEESPSGSANASCVRERRSPQGGGSSCGCPPPYQAPVYCPVQVQQPSCVQYQQPQAQYPCPCPSPYNIINITLTNDNDNRQTLPNQTSSCPPSCGCPQPPTLSVISAIPILPASPQPCPPQPPSTHR